VSSITRGGRTWSKKPPPLVEGDDEHRVVQVARAGKGVVGIGEETFTAPDVGLGMVIGPGPVVGKGNSGSTKLTLGSSQ
jgi:hypothetical protein